MVILEHFISVIIFILLSELNNGVCWAMFLKLHIPVDIWQKKMKYIFLKCQFYFMILGEKYYFTLQQTCMYNVMTWKVFMIKHKT